MTTRVIAISHTEGAGGERIGRIVSERLGFRYVDEEITSMAAAKEGLDPNLVADAEKRKGLLARFVDGLAKAGVAAGSVGLTVPADLDRSDDFRTLILEALVETAKQGEVVIVAHAASVALAGRDDLLRVLITATPERRAQRLSDAGDIDRAKAAKMLGEADAARADYLKRFYAIDRELPTHYDLVVNTDAIGFEDAAKVVIRAARLEEQVSSRRGSPGRF